ncbi:DNA cytosine methyltransferase [Methylobacterium sp. J-092]|uniref:DNA cytosine methyltransferase n=1 Tax=Methylobacterium sp. J-092 TaxID=2836667 RepID=UPI001FB9FC81|nr:DNA cytosine methyltransferase [Methylobacterium sp. J-092]MCJ2009765.1 DNA cytosine methyltransferase [Methylobacterium sp. J-092]
MTATTPTLGKDRAVRLRPLIIDSFAGGGGASEGIRAALGRDPDYALNHDAMALAMHRINHPGTHHIEEDVWNVDARSLCANRPVGLLWMSPDCKHFSKAKGGKPREKAIRGLAWVGVRWIKSLPAWQRPVCVFLENVEEFQDWGPLLDDGRPCPLQRGATFRSFVAALQAMGYAVEWRELRACDYGAPTIRKRLFLVARRDGKPIVWPEATHGAPTSAGVLAGTLLPWRTAAEIIDWSLPCPSIFDTRAEIKAKHGIKAQRPLKPNTMARIAKGTWRYVITAAKPFLVQVNHGAATAGRDHAADEPAPTMTGKRGEAVVMPFVTLGQQGGSNRDVSDPLHTITASPKDQKAIVAPVIVNVANGKTTGRGPNVWPVDDALRTVTQAGTHAVVAPFLAPRLQAKPGDEPRTRPVDLPAATITASDALPGHLVSGILVPRYGERPGQEPRSRPVDQPAPVIVPTGNEGSLAAIHMTRQFGASVGSDVEEPVGTITAGGAGKAGVVAAFLAQHNTARDGAVNPGTDARTPVSTITAAGGHQNVVAAHLLNLRGSDRRDGPIDAPAPTVSAGGNHAAAVYAFLAKYYGEGLPSQAADEPLHTLTAKPRHGVVTVTIQGQPYAIVDIGMRMLTPRERFNAQGFRPDYTIDRGELADGTIVPLTLEAQGRMCGNSVCPDMARALVAANYADPIQHARPRPGPVAMPLFAAE